MRKTRSGCNMAELKLVESNMPDWQKKYEEAVKETDAGKLIARICVAAANAIRTDSPGRSHGDLRRSSCSARLALRAVRANQTERARAAAQTVCVEKVPPHV
jgi:FPC/CPF motif-containing protein YcgG